MAAYPSFPLPGLSQVQHSEPFGRPSQTVPGLTASTYMLRNPVHDLEEGEVSDSFGSKSRGNVQCFSLG